MVHSLQMFIRHQCLVIMVINEHVEINIIVEMSTFIVLKISLALSFMRTLLFKHRGFWINVVRYWKSVFLAYNKQRNVAFTLLLQIQMQSSGISSPSCMVSNRNAILLAVVSTSGGVSPSPPSLMGRCIIWLATAWWYVPCLQAAVIFCSAFFNVLQYCILLIPLFVVLKYFIDGRENKQRTN